MLLKIKCGLPRLFRCVANDRLDIKEMAAMIVNDYLTGQWKQANTTNLTIQKLKGGHSNCLYQVTLAQNENEVLDPNTVLLRIYGPNYGKFAAEQMVTDSLVFMLMAERKLGPKLHGVFPGGRIEEYVNARSLKAPEMNDPKISLAIADKIAQMHSISVPISKSPEPVFYLMSKWLLELQNNWDQFAAKERDQKLIEKFKSWNVASEMQWLKQHLAKFNSKVVFCHNDLQEGNILIRHDTINDDEPSLVVIDYEYCSYNYRAFELANHFLECTMCYKVPDYPYFKIDSSLYPSPEQQVRFVRKYLNVYKDLTDSNTPDVQPPVTGTIDRDWEGLKVTAEEYDLLTEISHFRLMSHLMWGIWSATYSRLDIEFAYWEYSISRLTAYYETKEEILTSERNPKRRKEC